MSDNTDFYTIYEKKIEEQLIQLCTSKGFLNGDLLIVEELEGKWDELAPDYLADAIPEFKDYPTVAIAWAGFLGIGMAVLWDATWEKYSDNKELYHIFSKPRGFDYMDEYILEDILNLTLDSNEAKSYGNIMRSCANMALKLMQKEQIEPLSSKAFYVFSRTLKIMFKIGVSISLSKLKYKYEKITVDVPFYS